MIVDAKNNLLAVQSAIKSTSPPISTKMHETSDGVWEEAREAKQDIDFLIAQNKQTELNLKQSYINVPSNRYPNEVWDYDELLENIESLDPVLTLDGKMIGEKEEIYSAIDENKVEEENKEDIIIDFDNPEEPIVIVEDEKTIQIRELNSDLISLQEYLEMVGEDEEAEEEIKVLKQKIEALK